MSSNRIRNSFRGISDLILFWIIFGDNIERSKFRIVLHRSISLTHIPVGLFMDKDPAPRYFLVYF